MLPKVALPTESYNGQPCFHSQQLVTGPGWAVSPCGQQEVLQIWGLPYLQEGKEWWCHHAGNPKRDLGHYCHVHASSGGLDQHCHHTHTQIYGFSFVLSLD